MNQDIFEGLSHELISNAIYQFLSKGPSTHNELRRLPDYRLKLLAVSLMGEATATTFMNVQLESQLGNGYDELELKRMEALKLRSWALEKVDQAETFMAVLIMRMEDKLPGRGFMAALEDYGAETAHIGIFLRGISLACDTLSAKEKGSVKSIISETLKFFPTLSNDFSVITRFVEQNDDPDSDLELSDVTNVYLDWDWMVVPGWHLRHLESAAEITKHTTFWGE